MTVAARETFHTGAPLMPAGTTRIEMGL